MKKFNLNALGVQEMEISRLIAVNGGQLEPSPSPWWSVGAAVIQMFCIIQEKSISELCNRASKDGYVVYADIGHR